MAQTMDTFFRLPRLSSRIFFRASSSRAWQRAAASARQSRFRRSADRRMTSDTRISG